MTTRWQFALALVFTAGCSGRPGAIRPPEVDADSAASAAIELFDRDGDGQLARDEWSASPALAAVAERYDTSGDGALSDVEIAAGIDSWQQAGVGARSVPFSIRYSGRPLARATVRLVPAPFLGGSVKAAVGETSSRGGGQFNMAPEDRPRNAPNIPLMQPGLYHVEITHPSAKIPAKYNTDTTLGIEITGANPGPEGVTWSISAK